MTIICPTCASVYRGIVAKPGQKVRCSACDESWRIVAADDPACDPTVIDVEATSEKSQPPSYEELYGGGRIGAPLPDAATPRRREGRPLVLAALALGLVMAAIGFRAPIVRAAPWTGDAFAAIGLPVNLRGLEIRHVKATVAEVGGQKMLGVEGEIANLRAGRADTPQLGLALRGHDGRTIYTWTTGSPKSKLDGFETIAFRARLAAPPEDARDVLVTFSDAGLSPTRTASVKIRD